MITHDIRPYRCACGYLFECATAVGSNPNPPTPGDVTVCIRCGSAMTLTLTCDPVMGTEQMAWQLLTDDEIAQLPDGGAEVRRVQRAHAYMATRGRTPP